jgi:hypothetical protein
MKEPSKNRWLYDLGRAGGPLLCIRNWFFDVSRRTMHGYISETGSSNAEKHGYEPTLRTSLITIMGGSIPVFDNRPTLMNSI